MKLLSLNYLTILVIQIEKTINKVFLKTFQRFLLLEYLNRYTKNELVLKRSILIYLCRRRARTVYKFCNTTNNI